MKKLYICMILLLFAMMIGCKTEEVEEGNSYQIYYINREETKLVTEEYSTETTDTRELVQEFFSKLSDNPTNVSMLSTIRNFEVTAFSLQEGQLVLTVDESYSDQIVTTEVLTRAAIVKTMVQIPEIDYVSFKVRNTPLTDQYGNVIGVMSAESFIDNNSVEMDSYEKVTMTLYFANESGDGLVTEIREVAYNNKMSLEKIVMEEIIKGPTKAASYPVISDETQVISVTTKDGICYVNLNSTFLDKVYNTTGEVAIYAIVNSLAELSNINKVQFSVDGEEDITFRDQIQLTTIFERNLDLVTQ
ncbi:MAG: GerMN domain-containing protein [Eubacteriales bacterium]